MVSGRHSAEKSGFIGVYGWRQIPIGQAYWAVLGAGYHQEHCSLCVRNVMACLFGRAVDRLGWQTAFSWGLCVSPNRLVVMMQPVPVWRLFEFGTALGSCRQIFFVVQALVSIGLCLRLDHVARGGCRAVMLCAGPIDWACGHGFEGQGRRSE